MGTLGGENDARTVGRHDLAVTSQWECAHALPYAISSDGGEGHRLSKTAIMLGAPLGTPWVGGRSLISTVVSRVRLPLHYVQC